MIVCVCNCLREKDCIATAEHRSTRSAGGVYKRLGVRIQCGRCVPTMRRIVEEARARRDDDLVDETTNDDEGVIT